MIVFYQNADNFFASRFWQFLSHSRNILYGVERSKFEISGVEVFERSNFKVFPKLINDRRLEIFHSHTC